MKFNYNHCFLYKDNFISTDAKVPPDETGLVNFVGAKELKRMIDE